MKQTSTVRWYGNTFLQIFFSLLFCLFLLDELPDHDELNFPSSKSSHMEIFSKRLASGIHHQHIENKSSISVSNAHQQPPSSQAVPSKQPTSSTWSLTEKQNIFGILHRRSCIHASVKTRPKTVLHAHAEWICIRESKNKTAKVKHWMVKICIEACCSSPVACRCLQTRNL